MRRPGPLSPVWGLALIAGCTVGPDYVKPAVPETPTYGELPPAAVADAGTWKPAQPADGNLRTKWWEVFGDAQLNSLEQQVTVSNQDLKAAAARFREARAMIGTVRAAEFPLLSVAPGIESLRYSNNRPYLSHTSTTGDFVLPLDASYEVDLWGRIGRTVTAAGETTQATAADLETISLSLHAEMALDYINLRSADSQKQLLDDSVKAYADALKLTENRAAGGAAPESDVAQAQTQLNMTQVQATDIAVQRAQYEHAIAVLTGQPPAAFHLAPTALTLHLPIVPVGLPSELLQRRPDIAAAERRVAAANEQIGIAQAAYYPSLVLSASSGFEGTSAINWFDWPSLFWAVGLSVGQTLFDGGRRAAASEAARAAYDATVANYRQTALSAFQAVEDNLSVLRILALEAQQQDEAVASAKNSLQLFNNRYLGGRDTYLQVVTAQTITLSNQRNQTEIRRRQMEAGVLLIKALGGGWTASDLPDLAVLRKADDPDRPQDTTGH
jgi:NodT family efflux transporter outer membrane factor (OMF) lipoprotein